MDFNTCLDSRNYHHNQNTEWGYPVENSCCLFRVRPIHSLACAPTSDLPANQAVL